MKIFFFRYEFRKKLNEIRKKKLVKEWKYIPRDGNQPGMSMSYQLV